VIVRDEENACPRGGGDGSRFSARIPHQLLEPIGLMILGMAKIILILRAGLAP